MANEHPPIFKALADKRTKVYRPGARSERDPEQVRRRMYWRGFVYGLLLNDKTVWNHKVESSAWRQK